MNITLFQGKRLFLHDPNAESYYFVYYWGVKIILLGK